MNISLDSYVTMSPEVMLQEVSGEAVMLDLKSESYFGLDTVGTRVWRLVERESHLRKVFSELLSEYDVDPARLEVDLKGLIGRLADAGLVAVKSADERES